MGGQTLFWLLLVAGIWGTVALTTPRGQIWKLGLPAFLGGFLWALVVQLVGVGLDYWHFRAAAIPISGIPLSLLLAWWGAIIYFLAHLPQHNLNRYILLMAATTTAINGIALWLDAIQFLRWNLFFTFILAVFSHWMVAYSYLLWNRRANRS